MDEPQDLPVAPLRRLARGLLFDASHAEDVVQDAWLAALRRRSAPANLVGWLASVVRSRALDVRRDEARRDARERRAARPEAQPSSAELSAQLELLRKLLDAVDRLDEPYRAAIGLRFFDDLPPRVIAKRLGLPVNTVRTHVRRGLEKLRKELDPGDERGRDTLLAALAPFVGKAPWTSALAHPGSSSAPLASAKLALASLVAVVAAGAWLALRGSQGTESRSRETTARTAPANSGASAARAPESASLQLTSQGKREPAAPSTSAIAASWVVRGHVTRGVHDDYPQARLVGRVYDALVSEETPILEARFSADERGEFEWPLDPPTTLVKVLVLPDMPDHLSDGYWGYFRPDEPAAVNWNVQAYPLDATLRGTVRGPDGAPVVGARVVHRFWKSEVTTDASGRFAFRAASLYPDSELRVLADGFAQRTVEPGVLRPGEQALSELVLTSELRVHGRVLDEDGRPVAGAEVRGDYPFERMPAVLTDASGAFELGTLEPGAERNSVVATKAGFVEASLLLPVKHAGDTLELRLVRGVRVEGRVVSAAGVPVPLAFVRASGSAWEETALQDRTWSDAQGRFHLDHLAPGARRLWVERPGFVGRSFELEVPVGPSTLAGIEIPLAEPHFLAGRVQDEDGSPLPWAMVYVNDGSRFPGAQVYAGRDGAFRLEDLPVEGVQLGVLAQGHVRFERLSDGLDHEDVVLVPPRSAALAGRVVEVATGAPLASFRVRVARSPGRFLGDLPEDWSHGVPFEAADGGWRLEGGFAADGHVRVTIEADGFAPAVFDPVTTALAPDPEGCVARLAQAALVRGRVLDAATGAPLSGIRVRGFRNENELLRQDAVLPTTTTNASGSFELADLPTGALTLALDDAEHALAFDGPFELGGAPIQRRIELASGARIEGRLLDAAGNARAGEIVSLDALVVPGERSDREWSTTTGADGSYALAPLPAGVYHLRWERRRGELKVFDLLQLVELAKDDTPHVDLQPRGDATLRGTIQFDGVTPDVARVIVSSQVEPPFPSPGDSHVGYTRHGRATFAENGRFEISDLEAGPHGIGVYFELSDGSNASGGTAFEMPASGVLELVVPVKKR